MTNEMYPQSSIIQEQINVPLNDNPNSFIQFIERLKLLLVKLEQNSYVKDTTNRLKRIIQDAESQSMMLVIGKERVGKSTLINSLIGREILTTGTSQPTATNTFVRFGNEECVKAVFSDGMVATFDLDKIELFTASDTFIAQIIREHLDYIEIYIKNEMLKNIILIDSVPLEIGGDNSAYFSDSLLSRVDEVFWVLRSGSTATDEEILYLKKIAERNVRPYFILNATDSFNGKTDTFIQSEKERYGKYVEEFISVSALNAIKARRTNNMQMLIDSHQPDLIQLIEKLSKDSTKKTRHSIERFLRWLEILQKNIELIPNREPFLSAVRSIKQFGENDASFEFSRLQRDKAVISTYEEEYKQVSIVFEDVQTLYQLLQVIASEYYVRDHIVEKFEDLAIRYQQIVRDYRKLHSEYMVEYNALDEQQKKLNGKGLMKSLFGGNKRNDLLDNRINNLNKLQIICKKHYEDIQKLEKELLNDLYIVQNHINELVKKRLHGILMQVAELNVQRNYERLHIKSYADKLSEFTCVVEAQGFLRDAIKPFLLSEQLPLTVNEKKQVESLIDLICKVDLTEEGLLSRLSFTRQADEKPIETDFDTKYPLHSLSLTEADIVSDIPEVPEVIQLQ